LSDVALLELVFQLVVAAGAVLLTGLFLTRAITSAARRAGVPRTQLRFFTDVMRAIFILLAVIAVIHLGGLTSEFTALTVSGIAAIALSLALQATLTNVISGILLLVDGSIRVGDSVEYSGVKGEVVKIGLRNTWIKTHEGNLVIISNSQLASGPLTNYTASQRLLEKL
jgi:small-conductance mechanosensitive channel